jgi:hypothetical protein
MSIRMVQVVGERPVESAGTIVESQWVLYCELSELNFTCDSRFLFFIAIIVLASLFCQKEMAEKVTRKTIGVGCCPVAGIPTPEEDIEQEQDIAELAHELNLQ